jgi:hypothetical protein
MGTTRVLPQRGTFELALTELKREVGEFEETIEVDFSSSSSAT